MHYTEIFKIPFYTIQIDNWSAKKQKLLDLCNASKFTADSLTTAYTDYYKEHNYSVEVVEILYDELNKFSDEIQSPCRISNVWFQKYTKGCFHSPHDHGSLGFSSVCFVEYDENQHSPPRFICPFKSLLGEHMEYTPENIIEGSMIFFPSMLLHYVLPTTSTKTRTVMSMNINN